MPVAVVRATTRRHGLRADPARAGRDPATGCSHGPRGRGRADPSEHLPPRRGPACRLAGLGPRRMSSTRSRPRGIERPWAHQVARRRARPGRANRSSSPPAPRRASPWPTWCRSCPTLAGRRRGPERAGATALYLAPTKALAADQLRVGARTSRSAGQCGAAASTTATPRSRSATGSASTPTTSSPTRTCCTAACCRATPRWASFLRGAALRRHRRVPHLPRRLRLARRAGAAPAAPRLRPLRRRRRCSCWPRPPSPSPAAAAAGSPGCRSRRSPTTPRRAASWPSPSGSRR